MNRESVAEKGLLLTASVMIISFILIITFIAVESIPAFKEIGILNIILGLKWMPSDNLYGIAPMIIGSLSVALISLSISVPLSVSTAVFIEEFAPSSFKKFFKPVIQTLVGIPSVIYGFFGLTVIIPMISYIFNENGFSILAASIILAIMILPTIVSLSQDALQSVPFDYRRASLALGSTKYQYIKEILLPCALPGILTAVILAFGRAIGETLAVMMVVGNVSQIPSSQLSPVRTLTSNIALEMGYAMNIHYNALFATAAVLILITVILMLISNYLNRKIGDLK